ncbi:MAG: 2,3-bisphosphoglycerate-independent phosphoglycerate mutase [Candidatus Liptonbacteria bacterium]|nr:2,3-bisphosphoglycerate-independent phosphoglycerate mutase [Candidatus Liptonbacteria bacterium]
MKRTVLLVILDGWGLGQKNQSNPVHVADPQSFKWLEENFPVTSLQASGISVGLPWGEVGNSEVGHLTIGAGKVIYQYFPRITLTIRDRTFFQNEALEGAFNHARKNNSAVNLVGLLTEGTVHASLDHLLALIEMGEKEKVPVKLHLFSDGKDGTPYRLQEILKKIPKEKIATLMGRYYGMDREKNWSLTERAYEAMTSRDWPVTGDIDGVIQETYQKNLNEEFVPPMALQENAYIRDGEALIFFNFREDSIRQIAESFISKDFDKFKRVNFQNLYVTTMTQYEDSFKVPVAFPQEKVEAPLGKVLSEAGKTQLRLAESYKYAHVTYFFNAYVEQPFKDEYRVFLPSIKTPHPDDHPAMMAEAITDRLIQALETQTFDFILVNYANPDTIAHTGNFQAALEAVKTIDDQIGKLIKVSLGTGAVLMITSDHGNIEEMVNPLTGVAETQHDPNPVPFYLVATDFRNKRFMNWQNYNAETIGVLCDVAPTILEIMGIPQPKEMTGRSLFRDLL